MAGKYIRPSDPNWVVVAAFSILSLVLGFAYGNASATVFRLKEWQALIGATVGGTIAALALLATWTMASRTLRFNTIAREETRIEEELPALRETVGWLSQIVTLLRGMEGRHMTAFVLESFVNRSSSIQDQISKAIPLADTQTVQQIAETLLKLYAAAESYKRIEGQLEDLRQLIDRSGTVPTQADHDDKVAAYAATLGQSHVIIALDKASVQFFTLYAGLEQRRMKFESRLTRIRAEIEHYLDVR